MLVKSIMGYALRIIGYGAWIVISKFINEKYDIVKHYSMASRSMVYNEYGILGCRMTWRMASFYRNYFRLIDIYLCVIISIIILCVL